TSRSMALTGSASVRRARVVGKAVVTEDPTVTLRRSRARFKRTVPWRTMSSKPRNDSRRGQPGDPCTLVLFGASGDLAKRKLFPALLNLKRSQLLPNEFAVLGLATSEMTSEA